MWAACRSACRTSESSPCRSGSSSCSALFFRFTKLGLALRAAAVNPDSSRLVGIRVGWMLALGWGIAAVLGAVAGMMIAPVVFLDPNMMQTILLYAFAAAVLGGLDSPIGAVVGGILLGVTITLLGRYVGFIGSTLKLPGGARAHPRPAARPAGRPLRPGGGETRMRSQALARARRLPACSLCDRRRAAPLHQRLPGARARDRRHVLHRAARPVDPHRATAARSRSGTARSWRSAATRLRSSAWTGSTGIRSATSGRFRSPA